MSARRAAAKPATVTVVLTRKASAFGVPAAAAADLVVQHARTGGRVRFVIAKGER